MDSSSSRVKAFRARLTEDNYRRVEGYVSSDEKLLIDQVRREQSTTADVTVAGLLRLGLAAYHSQSQPAGPTGCVAPPIFNGAVSFSGESSGASVAVANASGTAILAPISASSQPNPIAQFFQRRKEKTNAT